MKNIASGKNCFHAMILTIRTSLGTIKFIPKSIIYSVKRQENHCYQYTDNSG